MNIYRMHDASQNSLRVHFIGLIATFTSLPCTIHTDLQLLLQEVLRPVICLIIYMHICPLYIR